MEDSLIVVLVLALVGVVIAIAILSYLQAEKRKKELREWAQGRGLSFSPDYDYTLDGRYPSFSCLQQGSGRYAYNVMQGSLGERFVCACDYHYETYSTDSKGRRTTHHYYFSVLVVETGLPLKPLLIRGETFFDKMGAFLGFDDINFELAQFSREFYVTSPDRRWAYDVLHQEAMEYLLESPRFALEFQDGCVIAYRNNTYSLGDFEAALAVVGGLLDRLPASVLRELKERN